MNYLKTLHDIFRFVLLKKRVAFVFDLPAEESMPSSILKSIVQEQQQ